jgi:serine/threonine protein kinase
MEVEVNTNVSFTESDKISKKRRVSNVALANKTEVTDFELMKKIGKGGFGEVYLCRKSDTKEILALKIIDKSNVWAQNKVCETIYLFFSS